MRVAGLPVSTTQVLCGALFAVGLFEGGKGLNWRMALKVGPHINMKMHGGMSEV